MEDWPLSSQLNTENVSRRDRFLTVMTEIVFAEGIVSADIKSGRIFVCVNQSGPADGLKTKAFRLCCLYKQSERFFCLRKRNTKGGITR